MQKLQFDLQKMEIQLRHHGTRGQTGVCLLQWNLYIMRKIDEFMSCVFTAILKYFSRIEPIKE